MTYRVLIETVEDSKLIIRVVRAGHRKNAYDS